MMLSMVFLQLSRAVASIRRVGEVMDTEIDLTDRDASRKDLAVLKGKVEFKHVSFSYTDNRDEMVLEDINFTKVKDKEILAIDFTNTVTKIQVKKGDNIGFITEDGRKGIMNIAGASGRYIDFKCKTQTIPQ